MMATKVYLAGKMAGLTLEQALEWRSEIEDYLLNNAMGRFDFVSPPTYYNYENKYHKTEREVKEFEIQKLCECQVLVVNLDGVNESIGTHYELAMADAINRFTPNNIFAIGFGETKGIHPWILDTIHRVEDSISGVNEYLIEFFGD